MSAPAGSTRGHTVELHDELMSLTLRLVRERPQLPAGSVMRCVARAVRRAMTAGTPREQISARAEHAARRALAGRTHSPLTSDALWKKRRNTSLTPAGLRSMRARRLWRSLAREQGGVLN